MKKYVLCILLIISGMMPGISQNIPTGLNGTWLGKLNVGVELRIVFTFSIQHDSLIATCKSPDQSAEEIPVSSATYTNSDVHVVMEIINADYTGTYDASANTIKGMFAQNGNIFPLDLAKVDKVEGPARPQNPVKPYPYKEEEVSFSNSETDSLILAGTLTVPQGKGPFKAVVLITGSGPQNRDEFLMNHSPFLVLADYLTRNNIIVLRYDDRGVGGSGGDFSTATSQDFASDAKAAADYLNSRRKELNISAIGLAGHSEGGIIAPMAASLDKHIDFLVLMAGTGIKGDSLLNLQQRLILRSVGVPENVISKYSAMQKTLMQVVEKGSDWDIVTPQLVEIQKKFLRSTPEDELNILGISKADSTDVPVNFYANHWMKFFLNYDPAPVLQKTTIPVLAINGSKDLQVPSNVNLPAIEAALKQAGNKNYTIIEMPGLNHLFQHCVKCTVSEYGEIEETFSEEAMQKIAAWINSLK